MLKVFNGGYVGFSKSERIGEVFEDNGDKWVVIQIMNPEFTMYREPRMEVSIVAQKVGDPINISRYYEQQTVTEQININGKKPWEFKLKQSGDIVHLRDGAKGLRWPAVVMGIESFEYEFVDLIVKYRVQLIKQWSEQEINKVVRENRLSTFKVIQGGKG